MGVLDIFSRVSGDTKIPTVALSVSLAAPLASPPYESTENAEKRTKKPKLLPDGLVHVKVGKEYRFLTNSVIEVIKVEKIWQDQTTGDTMVVISQSAVKGRNTTAMHISEFKKRVMEGGLPEVNV